MEMIKLYSVQVVTRMNGNMWADAGGFKAERRADRRADGQI